MRRLGIFAPGFLLFLSASSFVEVSSTPKQTFLILGPKVFWPGKTLTLKVTILKSSSPVTVTAAIISGYRHEKSKLIAMNNGTFNVGTTADLDIKVPTGLSSGGYRLTVNGSGGLTFYNESYIKFRPKGMSIYVQMDKGIYKPGQKVQMRIFALLPSLKSYMGKMTVDILDPNESKMAHWPNIQGPNGIVKKTFPLSTEPVMGEWKVMVIAANGEKSSKTFEVKEYVLPKFDVSVNVPPFVLKDEKEFLVKVASKYTYGKGVKGKVVLIGYFHNWNSQYICFSKNQLIDGSVSIQLSISEIKECFTKTFTYVSKSKAERYVFQYGYQFIVNATVTEDLTGKKYSEKAQVKFSYSKVKLEFPSFNPNSYKPGLELVTLIKRLNRKRKSSHERENQKEQSKKICDEKRAARTLLMLGKADTARGKSTKELEAAETLQALFDDVKENIIDRHIEKELADVPADVDEISTQNEKSTNTDTETNECSTQAYSSDVLMRQMFMEKVLDPENINHYTGMTKECFDLIFEHVEEKSQRINMWKGAKKTKTGKMDKKYLQRRKELSKLMSKEQFVLTLVRLRRSPSIIMLADIFGVSPRSVSQIFITWTKFLSKELRFLLPFPTTAVLNEVTQPKAFKKFENLRAIIDCTEFYIEKPSKPSCQRSTYSQYKSANTFKLLISMSPTCHINFISKLYSGSISDKQIVSKSGFLQKLQSGDKVMADKGFNIQDILALHETVLIAPPIMRKGCVSAKATTATRRVPTSRVHIERMIRLLKLFTILKGSIPLTLKPYIDDIVTVCACLVNLQPSVIKSDET